MKSMECKCNADVDVVNLENGKSVHFRCVGRIRIVPAEPGAVEVSVEILRIHCGEKELSVEGCPPHLRYVICQAMADQAVKDLPADQTPASHRVSEYLN